jgi:integrase
MIDAQPDTLLGRRNRALLAIGWGAALRGHELEMLDVAPGGDGHGWVEVRDDGLIVTLRRSKMNLGARGLEVYGIPARPKVPRHCPVELARAWLAAAGHVSGSFFRSIGGAASVRPKRLPRQNIRRIVKEGARAIGLDAGAVGGHSLRAGCLTWLFLQGVAPLRIQKHSGHADMQALIAYVRPPRDPRASPLAATARVGETETRRSKHDVP